MTILIIEDEQPASDRLIAMVHEFDAAVTIAAVLRGVGDSVRWLLHHPAPDLILADIQLNDGLSFEIFTALSSPIPVIFTTAYDEYLIKAFEFNSIDYILKPISKEKLFHALAKYLNMKRHFTGDIVSLLDQLRGGIPARLNRIVVKKGSDFIALKGDDIAYFYTEHKIVFCVDRNGKRYIIDKPLALLHEELDPSVFFRLNRKFIAHMDSIVRFKPFEKGKVTIELSPASADEVIVSQENASAFKRWMGK
jgi:two-component system LytT family response regulator